MEYQPFFVWIVVGKNIQNVEKKTDQTIWLRAIDMNATQFPFHRVCQMTKFNQIPRAQCIGLTERLSEAGVSQTYGCHHEITLN